MCALRNDLHGILHFKVRRTKCIVLCNKTNKNKRMQCELRTRSMYNSNTNSNGSSDSTVGLFSPTLGGKSMPVLYKHYLPTHLGIRE